MQGRYSGDTGGLEERLLNLIERARGGSRALAGKLLSVLETPSPEAGVLLRLLIEKSGGNHVVGVTGIPGAGKSTLVSQLIAEYRRRGLRVGVLAIDPSSPLSEGSLMADRLRMQRHATDPGVFIRSLASKGLLGGLSLAALAMVEALDAFGYDKIIVETVGVGQADVDILDVAHTILVVTMPGAGDDIQALKAGVMEIGDVYVLNKSDKPEAEQTLEFMKFALEAGTVSARHGWTPRLVKTSAVQGTGIPELADAIEEHRGFLKEKGLFAQRVEDRRVKLARLYARSLVDGMVEEIVGEKRAEILDTLRKSPDPYRSILDLVLEELRLRLQRL